MHELVNETFREQVNFQIWKVEKGDYAQNRARRKKVLRHCDGGTR